MINLIFLSNQAKTLFILDRNGEPLRKAISWLDNCSQKESRILKNEFDENVGYRKICQPYIVTTWPMTKILWLRQNKVEVFKRAYKYLILKDYIIYKLAGRYFSEYTIYDFSYYFDIINKNYCKEILDFTGINEYRLPELVKPGEGLGRLCDDILKEFKLSRNITLNAGSIDQIAGMISIGNIDEGIISETTGTIPAIGTILKKPFFNELKIPCHYNAIKNTYITYGA
jgi:sugar (pentulose or hexulose) kinase